MPPGIVPPGRGLQAHHCSPRAELSRGGVEQAGPQADKLLGEHVLKLESYFRRPGMLNQLLFAIAGVLRQDGLNCA